MMVDGGIMEGVEEVGGEGGGLIISDLLRNKENQETRLDGHKKTDDGFKTTLPYLIVTKRYDSFRKKSLYCEEKEPKQPFFSY